MSNIRLVVMLLALALIAPMVLVACGGDGDDEGEVEDAVRIVIDNLNQKNVEGLLARFTDKGLQELFDMTREDARREFAESNAGPPASVRNLSNTKVSGDTATIDAELTFGIVIELSRLSMIMEGGIWKIDGEDQLSPAIPTGMTIVDVGLTEFAFVYNPAALTSGNVAFKLENVGEQEHQLLIAKVPEGPPLFDLLTQDDVVEFVGGIDVEPGTQRNLVFTEALPPGRYAVVCFLPDVNDPEGTPHAFKGMMSEFTIR